MGEPFADGALQLTFALEPATATVGAAGAAGTDAVAVLAPPSKKALTQVV